MKKQEYKTEFDIISSAVKTAYSDLFSFDNMRSQDKSRFDIVTSNDYKIEEYIIKTINQHFPDDRILSEETNSTTAVKGRTWTIDPIDGTFNMLRQSPMFGIQCALYQNDDIVFSLVFLPVFNELYYAEKGCGAYLNGIKINVANNDLEHSAVSFGDFPHKQINDFKDEHILMEELSKHIAKIRMFGAACIDFVYMASGKTDGTIIFTKNKWDIAPGILIAREAGAFVQSFDGEYTPDSRAVIAVGTKELYQCIIDCANKMSADNH